MKELEHLRLLYESKKNVFVENPDITNDYETNFIVNYTYNSTAIEGNTLTLAETKTLLIDNKTPYGKDLREIYEQINHRDAFIYMIKEINKGNDLNEAIICNIHQIVTQNIFPGGVYRTVPVYIAGASHDFPEPANLIFQLKTFYSQLQQRNETCNLPEAASDFETACWTHAEFVRIHPFRDGNGRTSRLIMNYQLIKNGYLPVSIPVQDRSNYCKLLDDYCANNDMEPFTNYIMALEKEELRQMIALADQLSQA